MLLYVFAELEEVVSVYPSDPRKYSLQTTRSWEFAGLQEIVPEATLNREDLLLKSSYGKNVIIGILDSGMYDDYITYRVYLQCHCYCDLVEFFFFYSIWLPNSD